MHYAGIDLHRNTLMVAVETESGPVGKARRFYCEDVEGIYQQQVPSTFGDLIEPGFFVRLIGWDLSWTHATIFLKWETKFQKEKLVNYFIAIGGNQSELVKLSRFCVYKSRSAYQKTNQLMAVSFDPNDEKVEEDTTGFGITTSFITLKPKPNTVGNATIEKSTLDWEPKSIPNKNIWLKR